jgi:hypothetical protein
MHLLSGAPVPEERGAVGALSAMPTGDITVGEIAALKANVGRLESEVGELRTLVEKLYAELGVTRS